MYKRGFVHRFRNTTALYMPLRTPSDYVAISRSSFRNSDPAVQLFSVVAQSSDWVTVPLITCWLTKSDRCGFDSIIGQNPGWECNVQHTNAPE